MKKNLLVFAPIVGLMLLVSTIFFPSGCRPNDPPPCAPPTNVQVIGLSPTSATLKWSASVGTEVEITVSPDATPGGPFTTTDSVFTITGLSPETLYKITLRTKCSSTNYSTEVIISLRTPSIIIVDVIVQREGVLSDALSICSSPLVDVINSSSAIPWDSNTNEELLVIRNTTIGATVLIYKRKNANGVFEYHSIANGKSICSQDPANTPGSITASGGMATLTGTNYTIELTQTNTTMLVSGAAAIDTEYSMYQ